MKGRPAFTSRIRPDAIVDLLEQKSLMATGDEKGQHVAVETELGAVTLRPSDVGGTFRVTVDTAVVWNRKDEGRFPEMKELKQRIRDEIAPERDLGHSDVGGKAKDV